MRQSFQRSGELIQNLKELRCPKHGKPIRDLMTYRFENGRFEAKWAKPCCIEMSELAMSIVDSQFSGAVDRT